VVYGPEGNTLIYSRFPLTRTTPIVGSTYQQWVTTVTVPGLGAVRLVAGHPCNPFCGSNRFRSDHQLLRAAADANLGGPLIVAGDLNAVDDHAPIRALHRDGLESVTDILGAGWLPTYPANLAVPPLLPIDHVLVNHFLTATSVERVRIAGTDHLGLVAQIAGAR
jgi:endonuclease/exonuclease/phosphatase (EEP) superfamily protein YafD